MLRARLAGLTWALVVSLAAQLQARESNCVAAIQIDGPDSEAERLRAMLKRGVLAGPSEPVCGRAELGLEQVTPGWRVTLELDGRRTDRVVEVIEDAAAWVESWFVPLLERPATLAAEDESEAPQERPAGPNQAEPQSHEKGPRVDRGASDSDSAEDAETGHRDPVVAGGIGLLGSLSGAEDGSVWAGTGLLGRLVLQDAVWFAATVGAFVDPAVGEESAAGEDLRRRLITVSVGGGGRARLAPGVAVDVGAGVGLVSALATFSDDGDTLSDDESAGQVEALGMATVEIGSGWRLLGGVSAAMLVGLEKSSPDDVGDPEEALPTHPSFLASFSVGLGYGFLAVH